MTQVMNECLCFDRTMKLMTLLDEAIYTVADIKSLKTFGNQTHSFIIKDNYVYDTSKTYKIRKNYFYKTEKPVIKLQLTGEQIKNVLKTQGDFINEKNQIIIILDNVKRRNIDLYNTLKEYFIINEIKILSTKEEMKAFLYRIIHHFKDESLYSKKLSDRIKKLT